mmetsp:Transcript_89182/g.230180  ORF Transcript_89182/g.230180 Transcript_89182/m.230180 type:complete len:309 (-) Transcript_89182:213-1139(-)
MQRIRARQVLHQLQPRQLLREMQLRREALVAGHAQLRGRRRVPVRVLQHPLVLPPPDARHAVHQAVDLLQIIRQLQHMEHLDEGRDHAGALQDHGVDELEADRVRQREGLAEEGAHLLHVHLATPQEGRHIDRIVPRDAACHQEGQAEARLPVEHLYADALELLLVLLAADDGLPGHEEGLVLQAAADDVLARANLLRVAPRLARRLLMVELEGANGLVCAVVGAQLRRHLPLVVAHVRRGTGLKQAHHHLAPTHEDRDVQRRPAGDVDGLQQILVLHHLLHYGQRARAARDVEARRAIGITRVPVSS